MAGCASTDAGHGTSARGPASTPASVPVSTPTSTPASTPAAPTSSIPVSSSSAAPKPSRTTPAAPSTSAPSTSAEPPTTSSAAPPPGPASCTADQLSATGIRGGAYQGREIAGVLFTNSSSTTCTVSGYPFAQLIYNGNDLGKPAKRDPGTVRTITLRPGKSAQSQLTAVT